ncbi:hypothetical protein Tco_0037229 [Tanacetum coccineum]
MYYDYTSSRNQLMEMPKNGGTMRSRENPSVGMKRVISYVVNITPYPIPAVLREYTLIPIPAPHDIDNPDELCRTKEFIVVRHSIGNDEEFVNVSPSKICVVERTPSSMSCIYHELFRRKDCGWEDLAVNETDFNV